MMVIVNHFGHIAAVTGSIGEGIQMTVEERKQVMSAIIKAASGKYGNMACIIQLCSKFL